MNQKNTKKSQNLWKKAKQIIPGGTQLLSKRAELHLPEKWPVYFQKAKGVEIVDLDGNKFIDMSLMGVGSCVLGYADADVNMAVKQVVDSGNMSTLNSVEEVELAELLIDMHPWADMVRYARTGGEAMAIAIRIARAFSKKDKVAFCGYHGWHDWYLAGNLSNSNNLTDHLLSGLEPSGVPHGLVNTALPFHYNKIEELECIVNNNDIGVIVMEPRRHDEPEDDFLEKVKKISLDINAVLVFDEISSGFRSTLGGVHSGYKVNPDIVVFGKAISNGYPMSVVMGRKDVMQAAQDSFISSTYWTERIGPTAALATIKKMRDKDVFKHIDKIGDMIRVGWKDVSKKHNLKIKIGGPNALANFSFEYNNFQELKTLFVQEMLKRGFLASLTVYISYSHQKQHVDKYLEAVDDVFALISSALKDKKVLDEIEGPIIHNGFARLT